MTISSCWSLNERSLQSIRSVISRRTGGLLSYGPNGADIWRRTRFYVDRILKGSKPADLPVQNPTKFELGGTLKTAKALRIELPLSLLMRVNLGSCTLVWLRSVTTGVGPPHAALQHPRYSWAAPSTDGAERGGALD